MDKKIGGVIAVVIVLAAIIAGIAYASKKGSNSNKNTNTTVSNSNSNRAIVNSDNPVVTIYYGQGCPHCAKVEQYIIDNDVDKKIKLQMKEVWYNKDNANEMSAKADICKIAKDQLGVPFMYTDTPQKCLSGDQDVIDYLKNLVAAAPTSTDNTNANISANSNSN